MAEDLEFGRVRPSGLVPSPSLATEPATPLKTVKEDVRTYEYMAWCILNPYGDPWGPEWFEEPAEALAHLQAFWGKDTDAPLEFSFALAEVRVTPVTGAEILSVEEVLAAIAAEGVATTPASDGEASKRDSARATEPKGES